jgi:hypothetical protein
MEKETMINLDQQQKFQIAQDFNSRCDDLIAKRIQLIGDEEDIKYNNLPNWKNHRDIQNAYFNDELNLQAKKFIDNLLEEIYNRYYDKAKTGFGRIKLNV